MYIQQWNDKYINTEHTKYILCLILLKYIAINYIRQKMNIINTRIIFVNIEEKFSHHSYEIIYISWILCASYYCCTLIGNHKIFPVK